MQQSFKPEYTETNCPVCDNSANTPWKLLRGEATRKCSRCNHIFASPMPTAETMIQAYQLPHDEYTRFFKCAYLDVKGCCCDNYDWQFANAANYVEKVNILAPQRGRIFELGCSSGIFLEAAKKSGWQTAGVDPAFVSQKSHDVDRFLNIQRSDLFSADLEEGSFDFIFAASVLEHLTEPKRYLRKLNSLLKPGGGILLVGIPNVNSLTIKMNIDRYIGNHPPIHLQYFSKRSIITLLRMTGFNKVTVHSYGLSETILEFIFNRKGEIYTGDYTNLLNLSSFISLFLNIIRKWVYELLDILDLGSVMEVYGQKAAFNPL